jgi:hypothetical protein
MNSTCMRSQCLETSENQVIHHVDFIYARPTFFWHDAKLLFSGAYCISSCIFFS